MPRWQSASGKGDCTAPRERAACRRQTQAGTTRRGLLAQSNWLGARASGGKRCRRPRRVSVDGRAITS